MAEMHPQAAFPSIEGYDGKKVVSYSGMSLRDFFAAMALNGIYANGGSGKDPETDALNAYKAADAMLKVRG